ncbi:MAG: S1/P1 nuclease [Elusimicrobia bacterium]|nr:S1/P1 nuclease [Elusimicrobiota bacterium]
MIKIGPAGRFVALLSAMLSAAPASAFNHRAHRAIGAAAEARLSSKALKAVHALLGEKVGLEAVSACADDLLYHKEAEFDCAGFKVKSDPAKTTQPWHYLNVPSSAAASLATLMSYCPGGGDCVIAKVREQLFELAKPNAPIQDKRLALMYLVHLVGDLHQPLHFGRVDDRGGNMKPVSLLGAEKNLHALWDDMILPEDWRAQKAMDTAPLTRAIATGIAAKNVAPWLAGDMAGDAAVESFQLAKTIYAQYEQDQGKLGTAYQQQMQPVVRERLETASVRLAAMIERALGQDLPAEKINGALKPGNAAPMFD